MNIDKIISIVKTLREENIAAPTNNVGSGNIAGTREAGDDPPVRKKKPPIMAWGKLPGARTRFKQGADFITNLKKNKYTWSNNT